MRGKIPTNIKIRYLVASLALVLSVCMPRMLVEAVSCPSLRAVFVRGSGGERWKDHNYLAYKDALEAKLKTVSLNYEFIDLDYPAIGVGMDNLEVTLGAYFGGGDSYEFGDSVNSGVEKLSQLINSTSCPSTKYVVGGYSQGAMVVSKALGELNPNRIIYAATFGDPKIYLPEGKGMMPAACKGENLSDYRTYVPDCRAYKGLLGAYIPYRPESLAGKVGTWCHKRDVFCSSHFSLADHLAYDSDELYEDASRVMFDKICQTFGLKNTISSPHDTAILIDSTGSMKNMIEKYKAEALRLARETLGSGGRVALYDYRDLDDPYEPVLHCDFDTCDLETFEQELASIAVDGGGDDNESLLSASFHVMTDLKWKKGATKSLVVLTDANFLAPDRDGMTFDEVVALSKRIDPVNFYIVTNDAHGEDYKLLASATDGKVVTNFDELSLLTDYILERYDSLPKVEEDYSVVELPALTIGEVKSSNNSVEVKYSNSGSKVLVVLNDTILGQTESNTITIDKLNLSRQNILTLVPLGDDVRGEAVSTIINAFPIPKAPNTGKL